MHRHERPILRPGQTCWRIEAAHRMALIIDAADYFAHAKAAMLRARRSIFLIGWDFDLRIRLTPDAPDDGSPDQLGKLLRHIVRRRRDLEIFILKWDMAALFTLSRQFLPFLALSLADRGRIHLRLDSTHPAGATHHQKIVVIDDALAFCGGIDMTTDRWDTRGHLPGDGRRRRPDGSLHGPWHDATAAVDGPAARALGQLARERWADATGRRLAPAKPAGDPWPEGLSPTFRDVEVAIARTMPAYHGRPEISEIEHLYVEAIRRARRTVYLESQYFASARIADVVCERLREQDGPEIIVVNPQATEGWLEEEAMGSARNLILKRIADTDRHDRFRLYHPVNEAGEPIYVHAKILIVDDRLLRIGSSNINNRSLGFDSEADLALERTQASAADLGSRFLSIRDGLLAEHLDATPEEVACAIADHGSVRAAIDHLRRPAGRSLRSLEPAEPVNPAEEMLVASRLADPERPSSPEGRLEHALKRATLRPPPAALAAAGAGLLLGALALVLYRSDARWAKRLRKPFRRRTDGTM